MTRGNNLSRIFSDIVSLEAWHSDFDDESNCATVHVDLTFLEGQLGGESASQVRFKLAIKRAELVFQIPPMEPLLVVQSSVDREPTVEGMSKYIREHTSEISNSAKAAVAISRKPILEASGQVSTAGSRKETMVSEVTAPAAKFRMHQSKDADGNYRWELTPESGDVLHGKVWDPVKRPRLAIKNSRSGVISPTCRVLVRCRRQDFEIYDIVVKKEQSFPQKMMINKKVAAAAYISKKLESVGLSNDNFDEDFSYICIAEMAVGPEVK